MAKLLALVEQKLGAGWTDIAEWLRSVDSNSLDAIEARLIAGDFQGIVAEVETAAKMFASTAHDGYLTAGKRGAEWLDTKLPGTLVHFDVANTRAIQAARRNEIELVRGLTTEARQTAYQALVEGTRAGLNPRTIARDIRDTLTLTPTQSQHVLNYRRQLETGDWSGALSRELSSGQSDRTIRRLARDGGTMTETQIDQAVERYRKNYVAYRAETIARTETLRNVHAGIEESYQQAVERGDVEADQLVREWVHAGRGDSRPEHVAMDGVTAKFGEPFTLPSGIRMRYPGDPQAPVSETANCRCTVATILEAA